MENFLDKHFGRLGNRMFQTAYVYAQYRRGNIPDLYLQSPKYFEEFKDEIKQIYGEGIVKEDKVAIHFRRGDYVNNSFYVDLSKTDYYQKAMQLFPNEKFLLFSDDNEWLVKNWQGDYEYATGNEISDLKRFAGCKAQIIANSSWSWWGAYLGEGKVIYPLEWFSDKIKRVEFPKTWTGI